MYYSICDLWCLRLIPSRSARSVWICTAPHRPPRTRTAPGRRRGRWLPPMFCTPRALASLLSSSGQPFPLHTSPSSCAACPPPAAQDGDGWSCPDGELRENHGTGDKSVIKVHLNWPTEGLHQGYSIGGPWAQSGPPIIFIRPEEEYAGCTFALNCSCKTTHNDVKTRGFGELPHKHSLKSVIKS